MKKIIIKLDTFEKVKDFVNLATDYSGSITLLSGKYVVDGKSIMGIFSLDLSKPIEAEFENEMSEELIAKLSGFIFIDIN